MVRTGLRYRSYCIDECAVRHGRPPQPAVPFSFVAIAPVWDWSAQRQMRTPEETCDREVDADEISRGACRGVWVDDYQGDA